MKVATLKASVGLDCRELALAFQRLAQALLETKDRLTQAAEELREQLEEIRLEIYAIENYLKGKNDIHKYYKKDCMINTKGIYDSRYKRQKIFKRHNRALPDVALKNHF